MIEYKYAIVYTPKHFQTGQIIDLLNTPHITVKRRFKFIRGSNIKSVLVELREILKKTPRFKIELADEKSFKNGTSYIKVKNINQLKRLHSNLVVFLKQTTISKNPEYEQAGYVPHLTISGEIVKIKKQLVGQDLFFREMYFVKEKTRHHWVVLDRMDLIKITS